MSKLKELMDLQNRVAVVAGGAGHIGGADRITYVGPLRLRLFGLQ